VAEVAALSKEEYAKYWESEKVFYDNDGAMRTARNKGRAEGIHETNRENALKMKKLGVSAAIISQVTGLTVEEIQAL